MKNFFSIIFFSFLLNFAFAQTEELIEIGNEGIRLHDAGLYNEAIEMYQKGLALDKKSSYFHYEIGYSYSALKNYDKAIFHAKKALKTKDQNSLSAYVLLGNSYDHIGETKKSIATFEKAISEYPDASILHFNYGITLYGQGKRNEAIAQFEESAILNPNHTSSHYYLGLLKAEQGLKTQTYLALSFFLLLEPDSPRAENAVRVLGEVLKSNITKEGDKQINISLTMLEGGNDDFSAADLMLSLGILSELDNIKKEKKEGEEENKEKTKSEEFHENFDGILGLLESNRKGKSGLWWEIYYDLFADLKSTDNLEAFCHFARQSTGLEVEKWVQDNEKKMEKFGAYFEEEN